MVSAPFLNGTLEPLIQVIADRRIFMDVLVLIKVTVSEYLLSDFSASKMARCFMNIWHSLPIPLFVPNTNRVKTPCSTFKHSFQVLSLLAVFMALEDLLYRLLGLARGVDVHDSDIEKCCLTSLPLSHIQPCFSTCVT